MSRRRWVPLPIQIYGHTNDPHILQNRERKTSRRHTFDTTSGTMAALFSRASAHARSSACGCAYSHFPAALPARVLPSVSTHGVSGNSARSSTFLIPYFRGQRRQFSTGPTDGTQLTVPLGNEDEQRDVSAARNNGDIPGAVHGGDKMMIIYTCTVCDVRSARVITKVGAGCRRAFGRNRCQLGSSAQGALNCWHRYHFFAAPRVACVL